MPALRKEHPGDVALPVYLGDALQWNLARTGERGEQPDLLADNDNLEIFVPAITLTKPELVRLDAAVLRFPAPVAADAGLFDRVLNTMIELGARSEPAANFGAWMERETLSASPEDRHVLRETYEIMRRLQNEGRNHIWGYVARNLARPVWLSSEAQKVDVVIGNPPWVSFRYMSEEFQKRFRDECRAAKLWVGGKVATQQDLASYFYMRAPCCTCAGQGGSPWSCLMPPCRAKPIQRSARAKLRASALANFTSDLPMLGCSGRRCSRFFQCRVACCLPSSTMNRWPRRCRPT